MYIRIIKKHARFTPGQEFTATRQLGNALVMAGVAKQVPEPVNVPPSRTNDVVPDDISKAVTRGIQEAMKPKAEAKPKTKPTTVKRKPKTTPKPNPKPKKDKF